MTIAVIQIIRIFPYVSCISAAHGAEEILCSSEYAAEFWLGMWCYHDPEAQLQRNNPDNNSSEEHEQLLLTKARLVHDWFRSYLYKII